MKTAAIIVTFHPDLDVLETLLNVLSPQVQQVIVVDNGSSSTVVHWLQQQQAAAKILFINLNENKGIAAAQNTGIERAAAENATHVLLMDQDSIPAADMVNKLIAAFTALQQQNINVAAVGAKYVDVKTHVASPFIRYGTIKKHYVSCSNSAERYIPVDSLIASGTLISLQAFNDIGPLEEAFFIDNVDIAWCLAAKAKGWQLYGVCDAVLTHNLGERTITVWFLGNRIIPVHSPQRLYYMIRNSLLLCYKSYTNYKWYGQTLYLILIRFFIFGLLVSPRLVNLKMMWRGFCDGIRNKTGKFN